MIIRKGGGRWTQIYDSDPHGGGGRRTSRKWVGGVINRNGNLPHSEYAFRVVLIKTFKMCLI